MVVSGDRAADRVDSRRSPAMPERVVRRDLLSAVGACSLVPGLAPGPVPGSARAARIKLSCNLDSFDGPLRSGATPLEEVIEFCAELGFDAVDPTGYCFPGHPAPPGRRLPLRRQAAGLPGRAGRQRHRGPERLHRSRRRGAGGGRRPRGPLGRGRGEARRPGPAGLRRAGRGEGPEPRADDGLGRRGLPRTRRPRGAPRRRDRRVFAILRAAGYRGYAPLETLGPGDPREQVRRFLDEARTALA